MAGLLSGYQSQVEQLESYDAIFKALRAIKPLIRNDAGLNETIATSVEVALQSLMKDLESFTVANDKENFGSAKSFQKQLFPLD